MKRVIGLALTLAILVSAVAMVCTVGAADVVKQAFEVDFDEMTSILTDKGNNVGTTPFSMVAVSPAGAENPFSLVADANNGKQLQYSVATDNTTVAHYLDFYVAAAPYARIVMKANIKEEGDPRPYFCLYDAGLTTVQNDLWADQDTKDGKTYTFTFNLDSTGTGVVRLNLGAYYLPGTRKTTDGSEAGTVLLDDVTFDVENEYNELYTIGAADKLPTCAGYNNPVGLCLGAPFNGKYFSIVEENGERIVQYKNDEAKVKHSFISIIDMGAVLTEPQAYTYSFDVKVLETVKVGSVDLWVKMYAADAGGSMKYALCPTGAARAELNSEYSKSEELSYTDLGVLEGGKYALSNNAWRCGIMKNVAAPDDDTYFFSQSKCADEYVTINLKFVIPAGIRYVRMDTLLAQSTNNSFEKNEMYIKNQSVTRDSVQKIVSAEGWQEDLSSTVYNLVDVDDAAAVFANDLVFTSKNNPVIGVKLNGDALMAGVDYTIANNTVKLSAAVQTEAAKKGAVLSALAANGNDYTFTVAELTSGNLYALSVKEKDGDELITAFDPATKTYTVKSDVNSIVVDAITQMGDETVKINGQSAGTVALNEGANTVKVEVYKGTQLVNTYTLTVNYTAPTTTTTTSATTTTTTTTTTAAATTTTTTQGTTTTTGAATDTDTDSPDTGVAFPLVAFALVALSGTGVAMAAKPRKK